MLEILLHSDKLSKATQTEFQDVVHMKAGLEVVVPDGMKFILHILYLLIIGIIENVITGVRMKESEKNAAFVAAYYRQAKLFFEEDTPVRLMLD